jgi:hypothetical protein
MTSKSVKLAAACMLVGGAVGWQAPAIAGSDHSSDVYPGDYQGGSLPPGTFIVHQYAGFAHSNSFVDTSGNALPNSHANLWETYTRFTYISEFLGHKVAFDAELPWATLTDVNLPGTNSLVQSGVADPVLHQTFFFVADARVQRWLGFTNYVYLPLGRYDPGKALNVATPHQTTDVPEIGYTEGLGKFSPALNGVFFDFVANASLHSNGRNPILDPASVVLPGPAVAAGFVSFDTLQQRPSYDVKAFLRYEPKPLQWVALGIEKSWGGETVATNGRFAGVTLPPAPVGPVLIPLASESLTKDDYLRGHLQFSYPLLPDLSLAADIFHDFERVGGFKEDFGIEFRLSKFFLPAARPSLMPTK